MSEISRTPPSEQAALETAALPSSSSAGDSHHVMEDSRLSRFLDVKVERAYPALDEILEEEKRIKFALTDTGKARSRLYTGSKHGQGHLTAIEMANSLLLRTSVDTKEEELVVHPNKSIVFSPRSPTSRLRMKPALASTSKVTKNVSKSPKLNIEAPPVALRPEFAGSGLTLSADILTMKVVRRPSVKDDRPEENEDEKGDAKDGKSSDDSKNNKNNSGSKVDSPSKEKAATFKEKSMIELKDVDLSMMFVRPIPRGIGPDGAALRGHSIEVRRLKRLLLERGLDDQGEDIKMLRLRLTHADLLEEIDTFQKFKGTAGNVTRALNKKLNKKTELMRRLAKMHNSDMWRNLGNDKVQRYVETFTLVHQEPAQKELRSVGKIKLRNEEDRRAEQEKKAKQVADYTRHQHMINAARYRHCALCEHRFDIRNLTKTVTLKSVWNKRKMFPHPVDMPKNLEGRWDKLYAEVRVCALCSQFFEPDILKGDEDEEAEREAEAEIYGVETKKERWRSWSMNATQLRNERTESLLIRNKSVFTKPCGFGGSAVRPNPFATKNDGAMSCCGGTATGAAGVVSSISPSTNSPLVVSPVRIPSVAPIAPSVTVPRRPGTACAHQGQYLRRGDGALLNSKQNPRPKSAASRSRPARATPGFASTSSRIIGYRGHNELVTMTHQYRSLRIDPMQHARDMLVAAAASRGATTVVGKRESSLMPRRPASAGPSSRRPSSGRRRVGMQQQQQQQQQRPMSASARRRRRRGEQGTTTTTTNVGRRRRGRREKRRERRGCGGWKGIIVPRRPKRRKRPEWVSVLRI